MKTSLAIPLLAFLALAPGLRLHADTGSATTSDVIVYTLVGPPVNDSFSHRFNLGSADTVNTTGVNRDSTLEAGEPSFGGAGGASVWYEWTAPATGWVTVHTAGSSYDTMLGLFTGTSLAGLAVLGHNDDFTEGEASRLVFYALAGTSYQIAVGGYVDAELGLPAQTGPFQLHIAPEPVPPFRVTAVSFTPSSLDVTSAGQEGTIQVTVESDEALPSGQVFHGNLFKLGTNDSNSSAYLGFQDTDRTAGTATSGTYEQTAWIPRYAQPGAWPVQLTGNVAGQDIRWSFPGNDLVEDFYILPLASATLAVVNTDTVDSTPPTLLRVTGVPASVNVSSGDVTFNATLTITDALAGFGYGGVEATSASSGDRLRGLTFFNDAERTSGSAANGVYRLPVTIPQGTANGTYYLSLALSDSAYNTRVFTDDPSERPIAPVPPTTSALTFTVTGGVAVPGIAVEQPANTSLLNEISLVDHGKVLVGQSATRVFTIRNTGTVELTDLAASAVPERPEIPGSVDFAAAEPSLTTLAPGATTTFTVTFAPSGAGLRKSAIQIASNVQGGRNPFTVIVTGTGTAPDIAVEQPVGTNLVDGAASVAFGTVNKGSANTLTFTVKNKGTANLTGLAFTKDGTESADFTVTNPKATTLAPNGSTSFTVKFSPLGSGVRNAAIHIASNDGDENPFTIALTGTGVLAKPAITSHPAAQLVGTNEPANFSVAAVGAGTLGYKWLRNGVAISPGATTTSYAIANAAITHAGSYAATVTNAAGSINSNAARLVVVNRANGSLTVNEAATLTLTVSVAAPVGTPLTYQWKRNGTDLANGGVSPAQVVAGAKSATLSITKAVAANAGSYTCVIGLDGLTKESGATTVSVFLKPVINAAGPPGWFVSGTVTDLITAQNNPTKFTVTGLPAGVSGNATGQLSGKPTTATTSTKSFTVTASNAAGSSPATTVNYTVTGLPVQAVGTFNALVDRDTTLSAPIASPAGQKLQGHGGSLENLVVTSTGLFTGTLKLEDKSYAMPKGSLLDANGTGNPTATVVFKRGTGITDLTMNLTINAATGELTGTITDGLVATPVKLQGWRNPWKTTGTAASPANPATALAGTYTAMVDFADSTLDGNAAYPQGHGYGTLTVTTAGLATWDGVLADGTVVTRSTTVGPNGEVPLHWLLYTQTVSATAGSAHGWVQVKAGTNTALPDDNLLDTMLDLTQAAAKDQPRFDWMKKPQATTATTRSYKSGFLLHKLTITGGGYVKPGTNMRVLGLTNANDKGKLTFSSANLETSVTYLNAAPGSGPTASISGKLFTITSANKAIFPTLPSAAMANPATLALTINAATGAFSGSFTLKNDPDPTDHVAPITLLLRSGVKFNGVLVQRLNRGVGNFQLPQLPADGPPKTTLITSPQLSGQVLLEVGP